MSISLVKETATRKLDLRKETLKISLVKKSLTSVTARVGVVLDKSGSMRKLYKDGSVQDVLEKLFPIALNFDDNGELDVWLFNDEFIRMKEPVTLDNFYNYIDAKVMSGVIEKFWGQTKYAPVMQDVFNKYCIEDPSPLPTFIIFLTDGNNSDKNNTKKILKESSAHNIFWEFVGIGDEKFEFLQRLDSLSGRTIDNANFFDVKDIASLSDEHLYDKLLYEYPQWEAEAKRVGILR
ncbi:vWA domain-containing protein [Desulforamulus aeronauticus]|uniref:TerF vWA domain-containing protein n=1 Tax=Desulforamulus aeronauticus DSM 10349 TaxID=1121421 RepID=A0A1M6VY61_9FIRM|nr:VWA domain-containing protein [Desulforamulus aeronauticus]SHK86462.1 TerF vWA domain-containing protein [Desulforamulus aeronauticus DSM 10349]